MRANLTILGLLVAVTSPFGAAQSADKLTPAVAKSIFHNLHQIAAAADQYYLENGKTAVALGELVGPDKLIKRLVVVAGEDYHTLVLKQGTPVLLTYTSGETIAVDPLRSGGCTYAFHKVRPGDTPESIAKAAQIPIERLRELNQDVDLSQLSPRTGQAVRVR